MTSLILSGACGHMGRVIADTVRKKDDFEIVCGFDIKQDAASPFPVYSSPKEFSGRADVIIDFSGVLTGMLIVYIIILIVKNHKERKYVRY